MWIVFMDGNKLKFVSFLIFFELIAAAISYCTGVHFLSVMLTIISATVLFEFFFCFIIWMGDVRASL